jgi:hypothetical protein
MRISWKSDLIQAARLCFSKNLSYSGEIMALISTKLS